MKIIKRVLSEIRPYIGYLVLALIFAAVHVVASLLIPVIIGRAVDYIIGSGDVNLIKVLYYCAYLAASLVVAAVFQFLMSICTNKLSFLTINDLRISLFKKITSVPVSYLDSTSHGDIMSRMVFDTEQISDGLIQGFTQLFLGVVTIIGTLIFMLVINVYIALIVVVLTPLSIALAWLIGKNTHKLFSAQSRLRGEISGVAEEYLSGFKSVKAFGLENKSQELFENYNGQLKDVGIKAMFVSSVINPGTRFVNGVVYAVTCVVGAILVFKTNTLSVGMLTTILAYANQYTKPFNEITGVITELQSAISAAARVYQVLDTPSEFNPDLPSIQVKKGEVEFRDVCFGYSENVPLIKNLNVKIPAGSKVAIVGPTGCGKTTLINLLMRFYDVTAGEILVDNVNITSVSRDSLRDNIGMVLQDTWIFGGSFRDNIAFGLPSATSEEIERAADECRIHHFISKSGTGYDTIIGDDNSISAGQKQLINIARVMLRLPPILILDEATSNIDTRTEIKIQKAITKLMQNRTSFVIAHRLSTIIDADIILVMKDGNVVEYGSHETLMEQKGFYCELYNSQFA